MMLPDEDRRRSGGQELATSTLAEIYAQQGLLERARAIYERMAQRSPEDPRIVERLAALSGAIRERAGVAPPESGPASGARTEASPEGPVDGDPLAARETPDEAFEAWLRSR